MVNNNIVKVGSIFLSILILNVLSEERRKEGKRRKREKQSKKERKKKKIGRAHV